MKTFHLLSILIMSVYFHISSSTPITQDSSMLLQRQLVDAFAEAIKPIAKSDIFNDELGTATSSLLPRIVDTMAKASENIFAEGQKRRPHVRRAAPSRRHSDRWSRYKCIKDKTGKCKKAPCNFAAPLDKISHNPRFGCHSYSRRKKI